MKRVLLLSLGMLVLFCLAGCVGKSDSFKNDISEEIVDLELCFSPFVNRSRNSAIFA